MTLLWQQKGCVAVDEMTYFHEELASKGCLVVPLPEHHYAGKNSAVRLSLANWVYNIVEEAAKMNSQVTKFGTFLVDHHWLPIQIHVPKHHNYHYRHGGETVLWEVTC